ncbi:MBL fold metallo-hydrolase [Pelistega sp. MC2]|uniref:MBL fold metallo-hydrolase n=1 Tax=Pelistega sp. MC2 TaxID=1720297 RepID=UPI0008D8E010|nr:MBL fold metallo-hydrolase [Pelistega sp. MC2]
MFMYILLLSLSVLLSYYLYPGNYPLYPESNHYCQRKRRFYNLEPQRKAEASFKLAWGMIFKQSLLHPSKSLEVHSIEWASFLSANDKAKYIWLGHSTLLMNLQQQCILTDPVFESSVSPLPIMMNRFQQAPVQLEEIPKIDIVLISHVHYDHMEAKSIKKLAKQAHVHFITTLGAGYFLKKFGVDAHRISELDWWQSVEINGITYTAVPARHNAQRSVFDKNKTLWAGFVIESAQARVYFSGDTAYGKHFQDIKQQFVDFDIAFIENGQYNERWEDNHMFPSETAQAAKILNPKRFVPIHWGAYPLSEHTWNEPVLMSIPLVKEYGISPLTPYLGQVFDIDTETTEWYKED